MTFESNNPNNLEEGSEAAGADTPSVTKPMDATAVDDVAATATDDTPRDHIPATVTKDRAVSTTSSGGMKTPTKVIAAIVLLASIAGVLLFVQSNSSSPKTVKLTKHDMEIVFQEMLSPQAQQMIASSPEEKKKLVGEVKKILAVAQAAEREGYDKKPEIERQIAFQTDMSLNQAYR